MKKKYLTCLTCILGAVSILTVPLSAAEINEENIVTQQIEEVNTENTGSVQNRNKNATYGSKDIDATDKMEEDEDDGIINRQDALDEANATSSSSVMIQDEMVSVTPTLSPMPTQVPKQWYKITVKDILVQLIGALVLFVIPGSVIYYRAKH